MEQNNAPKTDFNHGGTDDKRLAEERIIPGQALENADLAGGAEIEETIDIATAEEMAEFMGASDFSAISKNNLKQEIAIVSVPVKVIEVAKEVVKFEFDAPLTHMLVAKLQLKIYRARSETLSKRIEITVENAKLVEIPDSSTDFSFFRISENLKTLLELIEEVGAYFLALCDSSHSVVKHLTKVGIDQDTFSKWNEALQTVILELALPINLGTLFNKKLDMKNLRDDFASLREELPEITKSAVNIDAIIKKLATQEGLDNESTLDTRNTASRKSPTKNKSIMSSQMSTQRSQAMNADTLNSTVAPAITSGSQFQFSTHLSNLELSQGSIKIYLARSKTLYDRIKTTIESVILSVLTAVPDLRIKSNLTLLLVLIDEVDQYFLSFCDFSRYLVEHLTKFGVDQESYSKWNERLQFIILELALPLDLDVLFDTKLDQKNLKDDTIAVRDEISSITSNPLFVNAIVTKLKAQESVAYKTIAEPKNGLLIDASKVKYLKVIGAGTFGTVWKARIGANLVAVKKLKTENMGLSEKNALRMESQIMRQLSHPRIVACIGVFETSNEYCMVLEFCACGSLSGLIAESPRIGYFQILELSLDICIGMEYLHKLNVVHRDLKPGNIVLDEYMRAKIVDFGLAVTKSPAMTSVRGAGEAGTPAFMAPECFGLVPLFSTKTDVYAFAIILWEMGHWKNAYYRIAMSEIRHSIMQGERLPIENDVPESIQGFVTRAWDQNPKKRPSFQMIAKEIRKLTGLKSDLEIIATGNVTNVVPAYEKKANMTTNSPDYPTASNINSPKSVMKSHGMATSTNITNTALLKFWENATSEATDITWELLYGSVAAFIGLGDYTQLNTDALRKQLDPGLAIDKPTLRKLYLVIQEVDPKEFFSVFSINEETKKYQQISHDRRPYIKICNVKIGKRSIILVSFMIVLLAIAAAVSLFVLEVLPLIENAALNITVTNSSTLIYSSAGSSTKNFGSSTATP